jgi:3-methylcrotonyl-CoA carboxylase alpha subunit
MEARLYAEDPVKGFLPSIGPLTGLRFPKNARVDTGFEEGDQVTPYYDPMLAKVICWDDDRDLARLGLAEGIEQLAVWPVHTNAPFLMRALMHETFAAGEVTTDFLPSHLDELTEAVEPDEPTLSMAAEILIQTSLSEDMRSPWNGALGFRMNREPNHLVRVALNDTTYEADVPDDIELEPRAFGGAITLHGQTFRVSAPVVAVGAGAGAGDGAIVSPMPGKIIALEVGAGDTVTKGQKLLTLEAMKMEHSLTAPFDGKVAELNAEAGAQVSEGALLVRIEKGEGA